MTYIPIQVISIYMQQNQIMHFNKSVDAIPFNNFLHTSNSVQIIDGDFYAQLIFQKVYDSNVVWSRAECFSEVLLKKEFGLLEIVVLYFASYYFIVSVLICFNFVYLKIIFFILNLRFVLFSEKVSSFQKPLNHI